MEKTEKPTSKFTMLLLVLLFSAIIVASIIQLPWSTELHEIPTEDVGTNMFHEYWFALILLGLVLLAALLGGIYLAKIELDKKEKEDAEK